MKHWMIQHAGVGVAALAESDILVQVEATAVID
jgi:hypothetical protein